MFRGRRILLVMQEWDSRENVKVFWAEILSHDLDLGCESWSEAEKYQFRVSI